MLKTETIERFIPFFKDTIDSEETEQINSVLKQDFSNISKVEELESEISQFIGKEYTIATNNETTALHLALTAMDLKRADKL